MKWNGYYSVAELFSCHGLQFLCIMSLTSGVYVQGSRILITDDKAYFVHRHLLMAIEGKTILAGGGFSSSRAENLCCDV